MDGHDLRGEQNEYNKEVLKPALNTSRTQH